MSGQNHNIIYKRREKWREEERKKDGFENEKTQIKRLDPTSFSTLQEVKEREKNIWEYSIFFPFMVFAISILFFLFVSQSHLLIPFHCKWVTISIARLHLMQCMFSEIWEYTVCEYTEHLLVFTINRSVELWLLNRKTTESKQKEEEEKKTRK